MAVIKMASPKHTAKTASALQGLGSGVQEGGYDDEGVRFFERTCEGGQAAQMREERRCADQV